jgi:hypothetical protein
MVRDSHQRVFCNTITSTTDIAAVGSFVGTPEGYEPLTSLILGHHREHFDASLGGKSAACFNLKPALVEIPSIDQALGKMSPCNVLRLLGKPRPGQRHPVKAASREAGARDAPAFTEWRRPGPMVTSW